MSLMSALRSALRRFLERAARGLRPAVYVTAGLVVLGLLLVPAEFPDTTPLEGALSIGMGAALYGGVVLLLYGSGAVKPNESGRSPNKLFLLFVAVALIVILVMEFGG